MKLYFSCFYFNKNAFNIFEIYYRKTVILMTDLPGYQTDNNQYKQKKKQKAQIN